MDGHWVFGGMERGSGDSLLVEVAHRDAATLLPIIANHVQPGSIVYSDEWSADNQLSATTGHIHHTVNLSLYFVDPATGAHMQGVEGMWSACKQMIREDRNSLTPIFQNSCGAENLVGGLRLVISLSIFQNSTQCNVLKVYSLIGVHNLDWWVSGYT